MESGHRGWTNNEAAAGMSNKFWLFSSITTISCFLHIYGKTGKRRKHFKDFFFADVANMMWKIEY